MNRTRGIRLCRTVITDRWQIRGSIASIDVDKRRRRHTVLEEQ